MKRLFALTLLAALCAGAAPAFANDPSCVLESCEKTDITSEAAKAMKEPPGTDVTKTPPQQVINSIEKEIAREPQRRSAAAAPGPAGNPYNQPESCDYYAESRDKFTRKLLDYAAFLEEEQLRIRADVVAYGQKLKEDDAVQKVKAAEFKARIEADQKKQAQDHVAYQAEMKERSVYFEGKAAEYTEQLRGAQKVMCCPPDEAYTNYLNFPYTTKWVKP